MNERKMKIALRRTYAWIGSHMTDEAREFFFENTFLAGGAILSHLDEAKVNDYDFYMSSAEVIKKIQDIPFFKPREEGGKGEYVATSDNAITMKIGDVTFQFILRDSGTMEEVIGRFDFTNCMGAYSYKDDRLLITDVMLQSVKDRKLVYNSICLGPEASLKRALKMQAKGFILSEDCLMQVFRTMMKVEPDKIELIKKRSKTAYSRTRQTGYTIPHGDNAPIPENLARRYGHAEEHVLPWTQRYAGLDELATAFTGQVLVTTPPATAGIRGWNVE